MDTQLQVVALRLVSCAGGLHDTRLDRAKPRSEPVVGRARSEAWDFYCMDIIHARPKVALAFVKELQK